MIVPAVLASLAGLALAFLLPPVYRSSALLLVESQQLPNELVGSPASNIIDKRIAKIRQQILSRPDLIELIQTNDLYAKERRTTPLSELVERMREATSVSPVNADIQQNDSSSSTIAFSLAFEYPDPNKAQAVAQDFVDRFMKLDSTQTARQAANTVAFLEEQAASLDGQLQAVEGQIEAIKSSNGGVLSSAGTMMFPGGGGGGYGTSIASLQRENSQLQAQINVIQSPANRDPLVQAAETQLAGARAVYSDDHPDVRIAEQRLAQARQLAAQNGRQETGVGQLRAQIASNNAMIAQLNSAQSSDTARAGQIVSAQSRAPLVMEQIAQLEVKANGLRTNYQNVSNNLMGAQSALRLSAEQKGERLSVIDPPVVPEEPTSPNRPLLIAAGIAVGLAAGLALAMAAELLWRPIRGVAAVRDVLGVAPLVVVPLLGSSTWRSFKLPWRRNKLQPA